MNRKIVFICFFFIMANIVYSQDNLYRAVYNGDIRWINRYYLTDNRPNSHFEFSNSDLRILRNTIYAAHGYIFRSKDLQEHFQKFTWYSGTKSDVENELSEGELRLIRIIAATEAANPPNPESLTGRWYWPAPPGSNADTLGFWEMYLYADGTMLRPPHDEEGFWSLEGTIFRIRYYDRYYQREVTEEVDNFRVNFYEYKGELYQAANFPSVNGGLYYGPGKRPPAEFWGYAER